MRKVFAYLTSLLIFAVAFSAASARAQGQKPITGYYEADDGGAYYIRQVANKIYWFGEDPNGSYANVLSGDIAGNKITAHWVDVPKGKTKGAGDISFEIQNDGATLVKLTSSAPFGVKSLKKFVPHTEIVNGLPVPKVLPPEVRSPPAGFLGGEANLTAVWMGDDYAFYYVRELPNGEVV